MKNFLKTSLYFIGFALAGVYFQISCSNSDGMPTPIIDDNETGEKIVFVQKDANTYDQSIWTMNLDGSNLTQIPITLPSDVRFYELFSSTERTSIKLSNDGSILFFTVQRIGGNSEPLIYSCNIDGTNVQEIADLGEYKLAFL